MDLVSSHFGCDNLHLLRCLVRVNRFSRSIPSRSLIIAAMSHLLSSWILPVVARHTTVIIGVYKI